MLWLNGSLDILVEKFGFERKVTSNSKNWKISRSNYCLLVRSLALAQVSDCLSSDSDRSISHLHARGQATLPIISFLIYNMNTIIGSQFKGFSLELNILICVKKWLAQCLAHDKLSKALDLFVIFAANVIFIIMWEILCWIINDTGFFYREFVITSVMSA